MVEVAVNAAPVLSVLTFLPLAAGLSITLIARGRPKLARGAALLAALAVLALTGVVWAGFDRHGGMQFVERAAWAPALGIQYHLGVDGLGLLMVALTALVIPFAMLAPQEPPRDPHLYFGLMLMLESGLIGTFTALNFVHWFVFWELGLIPAFFLIKIWGGPDRTRAAVQFFVYTMAGGAGLALAFLALFAATGVFEFDALAAMAREGGLEPAVFAKLGGPVFNDSGRLMSLLFFGALLGFAVKVPMLPFHTWLPGAYAEAPTGVSMVLTGAMSKMGVYGLLRVLWPIFPVQMRQYQTPLLWLAAATIVFPAAAAFAQKDLKRIVAYSSVNHLGYCLLGIFAAAGMAPGPGNFLNDQSAALDGVLLQMFNHGVTASALFYFVGELERRGRASAHAGATARHGRGLTDFGGLRAVAPCFCGLMGVALFASLGLPGLNGFVGEFLIFKGVFALAPGPAAAATLGLLITAVFLLTLMQKVFCGPVQGYSIGAGDVSPRWRWAVAPVTILIFLLGIWPRLLTDVANPAALQMLRHAAPRAQSAAAAAEAHS